jgi:hypothetical protein
MTRLSLLRIAYGFALLADPTLFAGRPRESPTAGTRNALRLLGVRHLLEAAICGVRPSKCVLWIEALVETVHAATMVIAVTVAERPSTRRAAAVGLATAAAFVGADAIAAGRTPRAGQESSTLLKWREDVASRLCGVLSHSTGCPSAGSSCRSG